MVCGGGGVGWGGKIYMVENRKAQLHAMAPGCSKEEMKFGQSEPFLPELVQTSGL